jgi:hypothetical protein
VLAFLPVEEQVRRPQVGVRDHGPLPAQEPRHLQPLGGGRQDATRHPEPALHVRQADRNGAQLILLVLHRPARFAQHEVEWKPRRQAMLDEVARGEIKVSDPSGRNAT